MSGGDSGSFTFYMLISKSIPAHIPIIQQAQAGILPPVLVLWFRPRVGLGMHRHPHDTTATESKFPSPGGVGKASSTTNGRKMIIRAFPPPGGVGVTSLRALVQGTDSLFPSPGGVGDASILGCGNNSVIWSFRPRVR